MRLTMKEKKSLTKVVAKRYKGSRKKKKGMILDEFTENTGYDRTYASHLLSIHGKRLHVKGNVFIEADAKKRVKRKRNRTYDDAVYRVLFKIWKIMNYMCGKRLKAVLRGLILKLQEHKEIEINDETKEKLFKISASTIDRLLSKDRKKMQIKSRSSTKPGTLLKHQIPIRTFSEWDEGKAGFIEIDLVGHDGGDVSGEYMQSLNAVDIHTGWTETMAVKNKAQIWVFNALKEIRFRLPFDLLGIDSDNGAEFINDHLRRYCEAEGITFTRSRPYRKNDSCYVEQKNYTAVRQYAGYMRYDTEKELGILNVLYLDLRLYLNFFHPVAKLIKKERIGSKVKKYYDIPKTPYQRVLDSSDMADHHKETLIEVYNMLNPAAIRRRISSMQNKLFKLSTAKKQEIEKPKIKSSYVEAKADNFMYTTGI